MQNVGQNIDCFGDVTSNMCLALKESFTRNLILLGMYGQSLGNQYLALTVSSLYRYGKSLGNSSILLFVRSMLSIEARTSIRSSGNVFSLLTVGRGGTLLFNGG